MNDNELTPTARQIIPAIRKQQKIRRRRPFLNALIIASLAALLGAGIFAYASLTTQDTVLRDTGTTNSRHISDLQEQMKGVCRKVSNPNQLTPEERDGCYRAENSIPPSNVTVTEHPNITITGSGLKASEVQDMIDRSIETLPKPPTIDQVTAAATAVYQANKPREFTLEDIRQQVVLYCGINQCRGEKGLPGENGKDAPPATPDEVYAQVDRWCSQATQPCKSTVPGPIGETGAQGVGIAMIERHCEDGSHFLRFEFDKPNINGQTYYDVEVPAIAFCTL